MGVVYGSKAVGEPPLMLAFCDPRGAAAGGRRLRPGGDGGRPGQPGHAGGGLLGARGRARRASGTGRSRSPPPRRCTPPVPPPARPPRTTRSPSRTRRPDMDWLSAVAQLRAEGVPGVLITVVSVRGHAPRDAGRQDGRRHRPDLGQRRRRQPRGDRHRPGPVPVATGARTPETIESRLNEHERNEHGRQCCGGVVQLLLEPLPARPTVAIFGVGHVGYELARILSRHEVQLHLVDSRAEQLDPLRLADVTDGDRRRHRAPRADRRGGAGPAAPRRPRVDHDPRPRRGLRPLRRGPAPDPRGPSWAASG